MSWLCYCTDIAQRRSIKLRDVWPPPWLVHYIYIFGGSCPLTEFCQVQTSLCFKVLRSHILAVLLHDTQAVGISETVRHGTMNGITELWLLVIFASGSKSPLVEFCQLENSLHTVFFHNYIQRGRHHVVHPCHIF